jgi:predicted transcriptional regulator
MTRRNPDKVPTGFAGALPPAELDLLVYLWRHGPATAAEVRAGVAGRRRMAHGSAVTLLKRLEDKGLVAATGKRGKAFVYAATCRPEPTHRRLVGDLLDRVFGGNAVSLVSSLFAGRAPSPDELRELRGLLDELSTTTPGAGGKGGRRAGHQPPAERGS